MSTDFLFAGESFFDLVDPNVFNLSFFAASHDYSTDYHRFC